ncbi:glyoxalase/bleomycin resistance/dioxygenase family protein [Priestia filamentosa]|uniref:glyoxalase/bleomycin resistance/dioxygenase family protein n=1 Tax=Priestia filamentosa TaxID=1402861 RepID=UPI002349C5F3|nr:glyoxalase/bleomycin resistance/dioxygenase family protein [Priestia filamentosa]WCM14414.1 glyoxalase/bleomycin resistance/dioxygenase family protein [Priestia filamentosa]
MITHYSDVQLHTLSIQGVKQIYKERLHFPILYESSTFIRFQISSYTTLSFKEEYIPVSPAHVAFQVPYSLFYESASFLHESRLLLLEQENGEYIDDENGRRNLYFRDGDGHLLEIIAHESVNETVLKPVGDLPIMYVREVGFPVSSVPVFREWLKNKLTMKTERDQDIFNFVISGTAHAIVVSKTRPWIPIALKALPPRMVVTFGTPDLSFIKELEEKVENAKWNSHLLCFSKEEYAFQVHFTPDFHKDVPAQLNLPF